MVVVGADNRLGEVAGVDCPSIPVLSHPSAVRAGYGKIPELGVAVTPARPEAASFSGRDLDLKAPRGVNGCVCQCLCVRVNPVCLYVYVYVHVLA